VTDYCDGGSLITHLKKHGPIDIKQLVKWALDIAKGMLHLHEGGEKPVVHRDLAARNVLLCNGKALVSDFGMARIKETEDDEVHTNSMVGPLKWMAPESIENFQFSTKSDVFSFGVVLWEMLTCETPWPGVNLVQAAAEVLKGTRMEIPQNCPAFLDEIITKCWAQDPADRPGFSEIIDTLKRFQGNVSFIITRGSSPADNYSIINPHEDKTKSIEGYGKVRNVPT